MRNYDLIIINVYSGIPGSTLRETGSKTVFVRLLVGCFDRNFLLLLLKTLKLNSITRRKNMHPIRKKAQPVAILMIILTLLLSVPYQAAFAALVETETMLDMSRGQEARETLKQFMARKDVRSAIVSQGVDPLEADARLNSLSDAEVIQLANQIDQLPAGGDADRIVDYRLGYCHTGAGDYEVNVVFKLTGCLFFW